MNHSFYLPGVRPERSPYYAWQAKYQDLFSSCGKRMSLPQQRCNNRYCRVAIAVIIATAVI